jgi:hypothetical protein
MHTVACRCTATKASCAPSTPIATIKNPARDVSHAAAPVTAIAIAVHAFKTHAPDSGGCAPRHHRREQKRQWASLPMAALRIRPDSRSATQFLHVAAQARG